MGTWTELRHELQDAELTPGEFRGLRQALTAAMKRFPSNAKVEVPSVSLAGHAFMLTIPTDSEGKPTKILVDHNPDLSAPAFDAYTDFRNRQGSPLAVDVRPAEGRGANR